MAKTAPRISVIERRLASPSPFRTTPPPIPLTDPKWMVRWENSEISSDHLYRVLHDLGWVYAVPADLDCAVEEIGAYERDGKIVRVTRGAEVLVKMRKADYASIQKKKDRELREQTFGKKAI